MPKALIAPHAGYAYSGGVAAAAFAMLRDSAQAITRVVLIGPAHYVQVGGIAAPTVDAFETRARSFKAVSPGMLPPLGVLFALFIAFTASQVWTDNDGLVQVSIARLAH